MDMEPYQPGFYRPGTKYANARELMSLSHDVAADETETGTGKKPGAFRRFFTKIGDKFCG